MEGVSERIFTGGFTLVLQLLSGVSYSSNVAIIEDLLVLGLLFGLFFLLRGQIRTWQAVLEERKLVELESRKLAQMLDCANDTIMVRSLDERITYWNQGAERLYGWKKQEVLGKYVHILLKTVFPNPLEEIRKEFWQKGYWEGNVTHTQRDGKQITVASRWTLQRNENYQPVAILEINNNISDRKLAEEALQKAMLELEGQVEERTKELTQTLEQLQREILDRQRGLETLHQSEQRYRSLVTATAQMTWIANSEGDAITTNSGWQQVTGQTPEEVKGQGWLNAIHSDDKAQLQQIWMNAVASKSLYVAEFRLRTKNGNYRDYITRGIPVLNSDGSVREWIGACTDITERKKAEKTLRGSEELYRTLASNFPNGAVLLFDRDLRFTLVEGADLLEIGLSKELLEGQTLWEVFPPETSAGLAPFYQAALAGETNVSEVDYRDRVYKLYTLPVKNDMGEVVAGMAMTQNITQQKQVEQDLKNAKEELEIRVQERTKELTAEIAERKEAENKLEQTMEHLKRSNQELERFAFVAAHDLQEPLRAITGYTQLLAQEYQDYLNSSIQEYMGYIVEGSTRMQHLVRDLLVYYRVGSVTRSFAPSDCNAILRQVVRHIQPSITESQAIVIYENLPTVTAEPTLLIQLFQNLIDNAIKFRGTETPQVRVTAEFTKNNEWLFCVSDNGIGIKQRYLERIFEIFKRLHTQKKFPGTGIGLAICKKIIEHHGGNIWVESEMGVGTKFYFTIPLSDPQ
ncbi:MULTISPECIES: PAS domain-containing sensor histidine kinase [Nostocales]|uniref:histidine kinase n=3 Tax=Nostocales TaxID=1161 RepID=A0A8S9SXY0_9CYAN|nr:PAS domain-containing sensor histidine kinase [Tolypothrix bouteillei]KAF3885030.1 PAS domain S-box protein [Tolypothrix bouteillei VB521301]